MNDTDGRDGASGDRVEVPPKKPRGFAAMSPERRRALARKGGKTVHEKGVGHRFTSETASIAGRVPHERGTAYRPPSKKRARRSRSSITEAARPTDPPDGTPGDAA